MPTLNLGILSIEVPETYSLSSVILAGPPDEDLRPSTLGGVRPFRRNIVLTLERVEADDTPLAYVARQLQGLRAAGIPREEYDEPEQATLGTGEPYLLTSQVITGPAGERVRQLQLVSMLSDSSSRLIACTLIGSHLEGEPFENVERELKQILLSVRGLADGSTGDLD